MSKSNAFENALLLLIFNGVAIADLAQNDGSGPATNLYLSLHTADPGEAGAQNTNETTYTGYARKAVARDNTGFTVSGNAVSLVADADFPVGTGGSGTITHFGVGVASSGAGVLLYSGTYTPNQAVGDGIIPRINAGQIITED